MKFHKYEATGNDFILVDAINNEISLTKDFIIWACARRTGIGADGVILAMKSDEADVKMRIFNADGSEAEMCGNGARALALYVHKNVAHSGSDIVIETLSGLRKSKIFEKNGRENISISMGVPGLKRKNIPVAGDPESEALDMEIELADGETVRGACVSMGNPHFVVITDKLEGYPVKNNGSRIENHEMFPEKTNVEFVQIISPEHIKFRVWERGVGETLACGTGTCAAAVAGKLKGLTGEAVIVSTRGGDLKVDCSSEEIMLTGPANHVFEGVIEA